MKTKLLVAVLFVFTLVFLTGCGGGNKLVCTMEQERSFGTYTIKMVSEISLGFDKENIVNSADAEIEVVIPKDAYEELEKAGSAESTMQSLAQQIESSFSAGAISTKAKVNKNVINVTASIDVSQADESKTKDQAIEYYEGIGYKCK